MIGNKGALPPFKDGLKYVINQVLTTIVICWYLIILQFGNLNAIIYLLKILKK